MVYLNDQHNFTQPDFNEKPKFYKKRLGVIILILSLVVIGYFGFMLGTTPNTIEVNSESEPFWKRVASIFNFVPEPIDLDYIMPEQELNRFDVLILGLRGEDDKDAKDGGALLTDTIMILSYDKITKKASLISIPRDLYVKIDKNKKDKINTVYEYGYYHKNGGINYTKELISKITGVYIDKAVVLNFSSFEKIIDQVDGIDIIRSNIKTDINIWNTKEILDLSKEVSSSGKVKKYVITTDNLLYESRANESYILLPNGDNFIQIKQLFQDNLK